MKRNLFLLLFAIVTLSTFAQTTSEHLTFKGVPIDGTLTEFVSKLKQKGLTHIGTEDGTAMSVNRGQGCEHAQASFL